MKTNRELFVRDPAVTPLMNNGQARIDDRLTAQERRTLREELANFVCEGQYADGTLRILESFLSHLGGTSQPAAWVSGFYGSGKSHLLKMLCHLWVDTEFADDGARARSIVPHLPADVGAALKELDTQGRRVAGLHAASGTLPGGGSESVRLTVLGIVLRSVGLPETYAQAKFCLYLRNNGFYDGVKQAVEAAGRDFSRELQNLFVSPVLHDALIAVDAGYGDRKAVRELLKQDFRQPTDITTAEMIATMREAISRDGELPCTIIVLDEVQLYIGDGTDRATQVVEIAEAICKQLDSRVMLVGAGQNALGAQTAQFGKLRDRFTIPVELSDADVETVTRRVLLAKRPEVIETVRKTLDGHAGEIERQLSSTRICARTEDRDILIDDYPLLPVRRRLWEHVFRAVDPAGTSGMLRSQLRIIHDALRALAEEPLGTVVPADFMFEQIQPNLLQQGVLLRELDETIRNLDDGTDDGKLARRLCGLIFLIRKLPREAGADIGVRATEEMLADLLVSELKSDGTALRKRIPALLESLVDNGVLLNDHGEYNLQTKEYSEWDKEFRNRVTRLTNQEHEIHNKRDALIRDAAQEAVKGIKLQQGASKEPRKLAIHFGDDPPEVAGHDIPVWIRDGWNCSEKNAVDTARAAGTDSPIIFVYVQKASAEDLRKQIIRYEAAKGTIDFKGVPSTPEGQEARNAMQSRVVDAERLRDELISNIVGSSKVFKGGGSEQYELSLEEKARSAAEDALDRLFPQFKDADHKNWSVVINRAKNGDDTPLQAVDWTGATEQHPVCKAVMHAVGAGAEGRGIRKKFSDSPYGWPQDAIDGALIVLHAGGHLTARHNGSVLAVGHLDQAKVAKTEFRVETATLSAQQRIKLRGLFQDAGISAKASDDLVTKSTEFLDALEHLAEQAGGEAPLPQRPAVTHLADLRSLAGNERLVRMLDQHDDLKANAKNWKAAADLAEKRTPIWNSLQHCLRHGDGLAEFTEIGASAASIRDDRRLLDATDRVTPLKKKAASTLRSAINAAHKGYVDRHATEMKALIASDSWKKITEDQREQILREEGIAGVPSISVGSDEELLRTLDAAPLTSWRDKTDALPNRFANAAMKAALLLEPKTQRVHLTSGTLHSEGEVKAWISEQETRLVESVKKGPVVIA